MNLGSTVSYGPVQQCAAGVRFPIDYPDPANIDRLDHATLPLIDRMHSAGIFLDQPRMKDLNRDLVILSGELLSKIHASVNPSELPRVLGHAPKRGENFNPNSGDQVARLLFDERELHKLAVKDIHQTASRSRLSTDDSALNLVSRYDPIVPLILDYRGVQKLISTYTCPDALLSWCRPETSTIHTEFDCTTVVTGRLASRRPNLMNIPIRPRKTEWDLLRNAGKLIRDCFTIRPDCTLPQRFRGRRRKLISLDLSQIEMVVAAFISGDATMKSVFLEGRDMHTFTALKAFGSVFDPEYRQSIEDLGEQSPFWANFKNNWRVVAKTIGFGILYGQEADGLQQSILDNGGPLKSIEECAASILDWFRVYSGVRDWISYQHGRARRFGMVWDLMGRFRWIPAAKSALPWVASAGLRECGNMPIQSLAQGLLKLAMISIEPVIGAFQAVGAYIEPLLQIHDELIFECEESIADEFVATAKWIMEHVVQLDIPIKSSASLAEAWGGLK